VDAVTPVPSLVRPLALFSFAALAAFLPAAGEAVAADLPRVEVFSSADSPVALTLDSDQETVFATVYEVDGIERFQTLLSKDLPRDPEIAKRTALTRIGQLHCGPARDRKLAAADPGRGVSAHWLGGAQGGGDHRPACR